MDESLKSPYRANAVREALVPAKTILTPEKLRVGKFRTVLRGSPIVARVKSADGSAIVVKVEVTEFFLGCKGPVGQSTSRVGAGDIARVAGIAHGEHGVRVRESRPDPCSNRAVDGLRPPASRAPGEP